MMAVQSTRSGVLTSWAKSSMSRFAGEEVGHAAEHHVQGVGKTHGFRFTEVGGHYRQAGAFELDQFALQGSVGHGCRVEG
jgi:hypothetical protein